MPKATFSVDEVVKLPLESCEGGFVTLKRMSYGEWLTRQQIALEMKLRTGGGKNASMEGDMLLANRKVTEYEFQKCIVDHNLEDDNGAPLDFRQATTLDRLDPRIGNEIADGIMKLHEFDLGKSN